MPIKSLKLNDYRNYKNYYLELDPHLNIIIGNNGVGKTNILESIIVVSNSKSFRTLNDCDLINKDGEFLKIELETDTDKYKVVINKKNKSLYINNNITKKASDFIGRVNAVLFKPSDLELYTSSPSERRRVLDIEIGKVNKIYLQALLKYNSLLKDKNKLLKELQIDETLLNVIEESMIPQIETIIKEREKFFEVINKNISNIYKQISNSNNKIKIVYKKCCEVNDIKQEIINHKEKDNYYHYATFGPHHDDFYFMIDDYELNSIASQGQKRMALIAFKFALIKYIEELTNSSPVLLLDDILSELDLDNATRLLNIIPNNSQVIITNTNINNIDIKNDYKLIELKEEKYV